MVLFPSQDTEKHRLQLCNPERQTRQPTTYITRQKKLTVCCKVFDLEMQDDVYSQEGDHGSEPEYPPKILPRYTQKIPGEIEDRQLDANTKAEAQERTF